MPCLAGIAIVMRSSPVFYCNVLFDGFFCFLFFIFLFIFYLFIYFLFVFFFFVFYWKIFNAKLIYFVVHTDFYGYL